jgi:hypothetical protein
MLTSALCLELDDDNNGDPRPLAISCTWYLDSLGLCSELWVWLAPRVKPRLEAL